MAAAAAPILFDRFEDGSIIRFDVYEDSDIGYMEIITKLRKLVKCSEVAGKPKLMSKLDNSFIPLDLHLRCADEEIVIRMDYVYGFYRNNHYWRFSNISLQDGNSLGYSDSYSDGDGLCQKAKGIGKVQLGCRALGCAITSLACKPNPVKLQHVSANNLLVIILMFAEAIRFYSIADYFYSTWSSESIYLTTEIVVTSWSELSKKIQYEDMAKDEKSGPSTSEADKRIEDVAIMLCCKDKLIKK